MELIHDLPEDAHISFYKQGEFTDLCAGPPSGFYRPRKGQRHQADRLQRRRLAGRLQPPDPPAHLRHRLPQEGRAGPTSSALRRPKRDHRRLGKELGLFTIMDGAPASLLPSHGMVLKNTLIDYWREVHKRYGYVEISTPSCSTAPCGSAPVTGITTSRTCTPPSSMTRITQSSR